MTQAVIREFATRTRLRVTPDASARPDAVLHGTILKETVAPLTYNSSTQQSSSFLITMVVSVTLTGRDGKVLYENKNYVLPPAVPVHHRPADLLPGEPGGRGAALARVCAAVGGRCAGRVLRQRVREQGSGGSNSWRISCWPAAQLGRYSGGAWSYASICAEAEAMSRPRAGARDLPPRAALWRRSRPRLPAKGRCKPGYVLAGDETFLLDRCRAAVLKAFVPPDLRDFCLSDLDLASDLDLRGAGPRADAFADGAVPGDLRAQCAPALHARRQEGRVRRAGALFPLAQPAGADSLCRRLPAHPLRRAAHGDGRQEPLRAADRDSGRALRHGGAGAGERGRRDALDRGHRAGGRRPRGSRCGPRAGGCAGRGHDADLFGTGEAAALHAGPRHASRWATWRPWCWAPSSARFTS